MFVLLFFTRISWVRAANCRDVSTLLVRRQVRRADAGVVRDMFRNRRLGDLTKFLDTPIFEQSEISHFLEKGQCIYFNSKVSAKTAEVIIGIKNVEAIYPIVEKYNFSIPRVDTECWCDCPGGMDYCNSGMHECEEPCVSFFATAQTTTNCSIERYGRSQMCCQSKLRSGVQLAAVKLGDPYFSVTLNVTRDGSSQLDIFKVQPIKESLSLQPGWFITYRGELFSSSDLNTMEEWDVSKLGWFRDGQFDSPLLTSKLSGRAQSCASQTMSFQIDALRDTDFPTNAHNMTEFLIREGGYKLEERRVVVNVQDSPGFYLTINQHGVVNVRAVSSSRDTAHKYEISQPKTPREDLNLTAAFSTKTLKEWKQLFNPMEWLNGAKSCLDEIIMTIGLFLTIVTVLTLKKFFERLMVFIKVMWSDLDLTRATPPGLK